MDFSWSEEQLAFKQAAIEFAQKELNSGLLERDRHSDFSRQNWLKCARFGLQGLPMPEEYGGSAADILTTMLVMEGLGYGCRDNGLIFALNAQMWSVQLPILTFGTAAQKEKYLPGLCSGELIGAHGMTEPDSGSDAYSLRTRAEGVDGGYVLNGSKMFVTNGPVADMALVFATVDPSKGRWGITAFLVDKGTPGFSVGGDMEKMGLRTAPLSELVFQDCFIPEENRLGREGAGASIFNSSMEWERSCILASHVGAMERQVELCVRYARERRQFGQPIGKFQSVANRIADMKVRLETTRLILYKVAWLKKMNEPATMEAAIAKLYLSESFVQSGLDSISVHGGYGYMSESEIERDLRDAIGGTIYSGTSDIQRTIIARLLGL
ncbi:MAG: acyl-CoA dehydrogenase family protein [Chloroflexi bacterium]|nr:acyl-CoA dehydrogenase family protein [Chloroflexota bacterium]MCI0575000.1 acyl-CoA dehydrogenase family protein [Chloroflexota bacterium]MCI0645772.1 acyl-CoA dehydrogenase family protein [Chloroflexota bacterium]MCI0727699.1 acyl-CoA dehydrogenase family protein [Chloroflexota bacterium]